jgi:uncharacterized MAPEG superfamily protein
VDKIYLATTVEFSLQNGMETSPSFFALVLFQTTGINKSVAANVILTILYLFISEDCDCHHAQLRDELLQ